MDPWHSPDLVSTGVFVLLLGWVVAWSLHWGTVAFGRGAWRGGLAAWAGWLTLTGAVVAAGVTSWGFVPLAGFLLISNGSALAMALSPIGARVAAAVPLWSLVAFHAFRLPLEVVLHHWGELGTIPVSMTWSGQNLDVVSGALALGLAPFVGRNRLAAWAFAGVGFGLLMNVARVAVLSAPGPLQQFGDPDLMVAMHLPYAWIVPVCVAGALFGHVVLFRRLVGSTPAG